MFLKRLFWLALLKIDTKDKGRTGRPVKKLLSNPGNERCWLRAEVVVTPSPSMILGKGAKAVCNATEALLFLACKIYHRLNQHSHLKTLPAQTKVS